MAKKRIVKVVVGIVIFLLGFWVGEKSGYFVYKKIMQDKARKNAQILEDAILRAEGYRKDDVYGGKTPQETYEMFIAALKKGDVEVASRYFVGKRQKEKLKFFQELISKNELNKYSLSLPSRESLSEIKRTSSATREYKYNFPEGEGRILFEKNINNIWKISIL